MYRELVIGIIYTALLRRLVIRKDIIQLCSLITYGHINYRPSPMSRAGFSTQLLQHSTNAAISAPSTTR